MLHYLGLYAPAPKRRAVTSGLDVDLGWPTATTTKGQRGGCRRLWDDWMINEQGAYSLACWELRRGRQLADLRPPPLGTGWRLSPCCAGSRRVQAASPRSPPWCTGNQFTPRDRLVRRPNPRDQHSCRRNRSRCSTSARGITKTGSRDSIIRKHLAMDRHHHGEDDEVGRSSWP